MQDYNTDIQYYYISVLLNHPESFTKMKRIINPDHFDGELKKAMTEIVDYSNKYNGLPKPEYLNAKLNEYQFKQVDIDFGVEKWIFDEYPKFAKHKAIEEAVIKSSELLGEKKYEVIEGLIKDAMRVRLSLDFGIDYTGDPKERLVNILNRSGNISSGFQGLDNVVGKMSDGDLVIYTGGSGSGKSLFLLNSSIYMMEQGLNVMYITLELNPELCARRMDSMVTRLSQKDLYTDLDTTHKFVKSFASKTGGSTRIKYMPSGTKVSEISAFCDEYMITTGKKIDVLCVDYLDLMEPGKDLNKSSGTFDKDKAVAEEVRNFGQEFGTLILTASQLNRQAVGSEDLDHSHIAGGISKINTADLVLGIITSNAMRERGEYQLQIMKTRNSAGTGRKVNLKVSETCMKIEDDPEFIKNLNNYMASPTTSPNPSTMTSTEKLFTEVQNEINKNDPNYKSVDLTVEEKMVNGDEIEEDELDKLNRLLSRNNNIK